MRNTGSAEQTQEWILKCIKAGALDFSQDVILVARNGKTADEPCTTRGLNAAIVEAIAPREKHVKFVTGDRVICTVNLPAMDCWNGTTGAVHAVDHDGGVWVHLDTPAVDQERTADPLNPVYKEHVLFGRDIRTHLRLAYALTVHKAQGSSYRRVLVAVFQRDLHHILDRSLLYTAVTRTRESGASPKRWMKL